MERGGGERASGERCSQRVGMKQSSSESQPSSIIIIFIRGSEAGGACPVIYQQNYMIVKKSKDSGLSPAEIKFKRWNTLKRNKKIFDIHFIDTIESQDTRNRRVPFHEPNDSLNEKLSLSFLTTTHDFASRTLFDTNRRNKRLHTTDSYFDSDPQTPSKAKVRCYTTEVPRRTQKVFTPITPQDEKRFCNFSLHSPDLTRTRHFDKNLRRGYGIRQEKHMAQTRYSPPQQKLSSTNFKKQLNRKDITLKPRYSSFLLTEIAPYKISSAMSKTEPNWSKSLQNFDHLSSKEEPSQFERNFHTPLQNFRQKSKETKARSVCGIKVKNTKAAVKFKRSEVCDTKFFRLMAPSQEGSALT